MGKTKPKKRFSGSNVRNNPATLSVATEEEFEVCADDVWQRIASQLQSGYYLL